MSPNPALAILGPALLLPLGGCCSLAALFCGPDRSAWISESYETPEAALATFLEAVRRDNPRVICEALSRDFRKRRGIPGCFETAVAWEKIKQETAGAHLLGQAEVSDPMPFGAGNVRYFLEVAGYRLRVDLTPLAKVGVRYSVSGFEDRMEEYVNDLGDHVRLSPGGTVDLRLVLDGLPSNVSASDIIEVVATHDWKIDDLAEIVDPAP